ncbi:MAG: hypothetical protein M3O15_02135 [Acidobacteriota bacterium]|nr:hypothetical protein [Acidobacteriota bacterium]
MTVEFRHRLAGLVGLAGALLFFAGDMLFYGYFGGGATFHQGMIETVQRASVERLFAGGLVGPVAALLCMVGFLHVRDNVVPWSAILGQVVFFGFIALMVVGSATHALWTAKGLVIKYCTGQPAAPCPELLATIQDYWRLVYDMAEVPGYLASILLLVLVLLGKTAYPRWTALANPGVLLLLSPLTDWVPAPMGAVLAGGTANLSIAAFFLISVVSTWRRRRPEPGPGGQAETGS